MEAFDQSMPVYGSQRVLVKVIPTYSHFRRLIIRSDRHREDFFIYFALSVGLLNEQVHIRVVLIGRRKPKNAFSLQRAEPGLRRYIIHR